MRLHPILLLVLLSTHAVPAQGKGTAIVPKSAPMILAAAEDIQSLLALLPKSACGRLLAEPEVTAAFDTAVGRWRVLARRREAVLQAALALEVASPDAIATRIWSQIDLRDFTRIEVANVRSEEHEHMPFTFAQFACTPKAEGRLTRLFEEHAKALTASKRVVAAPDVKLDGNPVYAFDPGPDQKDEEMVIMGPQSVWLLHLPGLFAFGDGRPEAYTKVAELKTQPAGVSIALDLKAYVGMFAGFGAVPPEFAAIGLDTIERLHWRASFAGERVLDEFEASLDGKPGGIIGALLTGKAQLPAQALPEGALLQLRAAVDLATLIDSVGKMAGGELPMTEAMQKDLAAALDGSLAFGVCAPAPGSFLPRMFASLRIADAKALDRLLAQLLPEGLPKKDVTYEGVACTVISPPGAPSALQPTFCKREGMLHIAESGLSMRAFLKAQKEGVTAMDVGAAPLPQGPGDPLASFDLRWDEAAMYRAFHEVWLPLFALSGGDPAAKPLLKRDDMPEPKVVEKFTGKGRGVLRKTANAYLLQNLAPLGGPELAGLAMTWGPILSGWFHNDWTIENLEGEIARKKLETVWPALEAYKKDKGDWPAKLGDLYVHGKLAADALLLPGDEGEPVELPAGDERKIRSSFRYFPKAVKLEQDESKVLLVELASRRYRRAMLADDGNMPMVWGDDSTKPIDQFGK